MHVRGPEPLESLNLSASSFTLRFVLLLVSTAFVVTLARFALGMPAEGSMIVSTFLAGGSASASASAFLFRFLSFFAADLDDEGAVDTVDGWPVLPRAAKISSISDLAMSGTERKATEEEMTRLVDL